MSPAAGATAFIRDVFAEIRNRTLEGPVPRSRASDDLAWVATSAISATQPRPPRADLLPQSGTAESIEPVIWLAALVGDRVDVDFGAVPSLDNRVDAGVGKPLDEVDPRRSVVMRGARDKTTHSRKAVQSIERLSYRSDKPVTETR